MVIFWGLFLVFMAVMLNVLSLILVLDGLDVHKEMQNKGKGVKSLGLLLEKTGRKRPFLMVPLFISCVVCGVGVVLSTLYQSSIFITIMLLLLMIGAGGVWSWSYWLWFSAFKTLRSAMEPDFSTRG